MEPKECDMQSDDIFAIEIPKWRRCQRKHVHYKSRSKKWVFAKLKSEMTQPIKRIK